MSTVNYIGLARAADFGRTRPTVSSSTTALAIELVLVTDDGDGGILSRAEALAGIEAIHGYLSLCDWPPS